MLRILLDCLGASGTDHATHRGDPPTQRDSVVGDAGWWWERSAEIPAEPKDDPAWDAKKTRFRRQTPAAPTPPALGFGGVFFEPSAKLAHAFLRGLKVLVHRLFQNPSQPPQPVAGLPGLQLNMTDLLQKLHHHDAIPAGALQSEMFGRFRQGLFQFPTGGRIHPRGPARTSFVDHTVEPLPVGFANPVHHRLATDAEQLTDRRGLPTGQQQKQAGNADSVPGPWNALGFPQQGLAGQRRVRHFEWFHASSLIRNHLICQVI